MKQKEKRLGSSSWRMWLIAAPGIVYLFINNYLPMFGVFLAFKDYKYTRGIFGSAWCGFDNFEFLFRTSDAWIMTRNTLLYNLSFIVVGTAASIFLAILLTELGERLRAKFFQASLLLPNLLSWVVIGVISFAFFNADSGFLDNRVLPALGLQPISFYSETKYWPLILLLVYLWKNTGYTCIIYMASIAGISKDIYESAQLDGASKLQQIFRITLPMLKPTVIITTLMSVGRVFFSDFGLFYQVPQNAGKLFPVTQTIDTYVYRALMDSNNISMAAAAALFQSVMGFLLVVSANALVRKIDKDNALF
ncbi:MAG: ABC transporter permease subunit [Candidatus Faecousia sp.]|nr:ABC transporter permease subunit [Candidatus Faecousia sp.]